MKNAARATRRNVPEDGILHVFISYITARSWHYGPRIYLLLVSRILISGSPTKSMNRGIIASGIRVVEIMFPYIPSNANIRHGLHRR
jgi:hypothetical protein